MSQLTIYSDQSPNQPTVNTSEHAEIARHLQEAGVRFEVWKTDQELEAGASSETVMAAYAQEIARLKAEEGYQTVDVISLTSDNPNKAALRSKFLSEHRHTEDEVRFFVQGEGLFSLHINENVYEVLCQQGDLISVPANTPHWFDMGPNPSFIAIRFFNNPDGWVAHYTGTDIAEQFSRLEN